jgi:hypothetical protein
VHRGLIHGCLKKPHYATEAEAKSELQGRAGSKGHIMKIYRCQLHGGYCIGHRPVHASRRRGR